MTWIPSSASDTGDIGGRIEELEKLINEQKEILRKIEAAE